MASPRMSPADEEQSSTDIDDLHYSLQVEQENTQKRTFTSWVNSQLEKRIPPSVVSDLYADVGEGHVLLDLLEVLSGQQLSREKGSNTFQRRSNIENALTFLKNKSIKLINIHVADIIEGKPSIILGLIWTIILHFHIEELARTLACGYDSPSVDGSNTEGPSPTASPPAKRPATGKERWKMSAKKALLFWAKEQCAKHGSVSIADFKSSWRNGLAFLAVIHALRPDLVDMERVKGRSNKENLKEAFQIAEKELNIPRLLEPEDVDVISPDEKSIMTYVAQFLQHFKSSPVAEEEMQGKVTETLSWLDAQQKKLRKLLAETDNLPFNEKFQEMLSFMKVFNEEKKAFLPLLASKGHAPEVSEDYLKMREAWDGLVTQMNEWKAKLDRLLPPPLDAIEGWLQVVEHQLAEDLPDSQEPCKAVAVLKGKMKSIQSWMGRFEQNWQTLQAFDNRDEGGMPLVPSQKLEEMRRRFSNIQLTDFNIFMEYYHSFCSAILEELMSKLNIWDIKYGNKETVESQLSEWHGFIEAKGFLGQLETAFRICEQKKKKILSTPNLGATSEDACKLFKLVESQISRCKKYIDNVNENLRKILTAWDTYSENTQLLKAWLEETRKEPPKEVTAEILAAWNSRHGSLNEAGNFLIESSTEEVGSAISAELKKLNRKWAKLIKKTQFEMRLLRTQEEEVKIRNDSLGNADLLMKEEPDGHGHPMDGSEETLRMYFERSEAFPAVHGADSRSPEQFLSEKEVKRNFEDAYKELEASVLKAMQVLDQKTSPEGTISQHEEAFSILDTNILHKFLKAAEQLKDISPACEKAVVEEKSKDVRERWEAVRHEIFSFIQLKMEVEREKLNKVFTKLNKQINKEKKLLGTGKTKGLLEEHEAVFTQQGSLGELNTCLEAVKRMDEKMTEEEKQCGKKTPVAEYERKKEELRRRASAVYTALVSRADVNYLPKTGDFLLASSNGENASPLHLSDELSAEEGQGGVVHKKVELGKKLQNGGHHAEKFGRNGDAPSERLKDSYDTASHNLKLHLSSIRKNVSSALTDVKDISCFQNKLQELEALQNKGDSARKWLAALQLEKVSGHTEKLGISENPQEELLGEWNELHSILNKRVESLKAALALLFPIQNEWIQLCNSDKQLRNRDISHAVLSNSGLPFKKVKKMQASIADCVRRCGRIEQECFSRGEIDPIDRQTVSTMIGEHKTQLEELGSKIQVLEATLHDLETFLAFLNRIKQSAGTPTPLAGTPKSLGEGISLQEILLMKKEAKSLDEKLKQIDIRLEVPETGQKICCEELISPLAPKEIPTAVSSEEQEIGETCRVQNEFVLKNSEVLKSIQDIHDKISKIGLRDPTIPAVQQRSKLLSELRQKLERLSGEMRSLNETARQLSRSTKDGAEEVKQQWGLTEGLWKKARLFITERQEHCARVIELLKQYHSCKSSLAGIIQKQEQALSQQASYMGKENLQRTIAKINIAKQEFNSRSEDVDRISQICKNLQSHLNKMKSFEEPPFENEANAIVDRWLDINERTENYCDNLGRALALWDKLLNLSSLIDEWSNTELKSLERGPLTGKELAELEAGLQFQEKNLEEFDTKVEEIQTLLSGSEPPLELQVIKSSLLNKMELIRNHLPSKPIPTVLNGNTAELKGDLDLAKTQIGMTESLLKALSPSDTLEIFTKLEEINQKILQQKHHVKLLQKETGCLSPEVAELKKQLKSITDLFNAKKQIFQDHFITLLNYQCEDFKDWFSSTQLSLKECFNPSETKEELEEKIQRLMSFLNFEEKGKEIREVKTLLNQVKSYLPKANVSQLSSWVRDQDAGLERVTCECQAREQELRISLLQFARLEDEFGSLEEWLNLQEEKWQEIQMEKPELEHFYQILLKQRESFDSFSWLANSLRKAGFSDDEVVIESSQLVNKYKLLVSHIRKSLGVPQVLSAEEKNFEDLAQSMFCWVQRLKESVLGLTSKESKMPVDERLCQIKEIVLLKDEGNAKLQSIASLGEHLKSDSTSKNVAIQQLVSDVRNQWECTIQLATEYLRHQEQLQLQKEQDKQREDDIRAALCDLGRQKQELNLDLQRGSQEAPSQLANGTLLLHEMEDLTFLLKEVAKQRNSCGDAAISGESLMALQQLQGDLRSHLKATLKLLEGHVEEQRRCKELIKPLKATLRELLEPTKPDQKQVHQNNLFQIENTLQGIIDILDATRQKISPLEFVHSKDMMDASEIKHKKHLKTVLGHMEYQAGSMQNNIFKQNGRPPDELQTQQKIDEVKNSEKLASSGIPFAAGENSVTEVLDGSQKEQSEEPSRMEDQVNREAQQLFQEHLTSKKQFPSPVAMESIAELPSVTQDSEAEPASEKDILREDQPVAAYAELAEKVKMVKIPAAELDIVLVNDQLKEIENLCAQLEKQKAQALSLSQGEFLTEAERSKSSLPDPPNIDSSRWDNLLQELMAIKAAKEDQLSLVNNYQECLAAVQSSMQHLSVAKESIKIRGPIEDTVLLENIKRCLASIHKERDLLQKLKSEHESLSRHLTGMDKELTQSQVSQVEQWWKQMEESLQRKQFQIAAEADEFKLFRDKVQDLQRSLQEQHHLQAGLDTCGGEEHTHPALLATERQTLKHRVSLLRRDAEERMKRIWSDSGKKALESAINDLQNHVEELEQLTPREDARISGHCPQVCEIVKKIEEAILWAKISLLRVDENIALSPEDLLFQIQNCKALIHAAEERKATVKQLAEEVRSITPQLESSEASVLDLLSQKLQACYQDLLPKLVQKLEQLESQLENRQKLFADTEKSEAHLRIIERRSIPDSCKTNQKSELDHWQDIVEETVKEIEEIEGLVDANYQDLPKGLNVFERLFLNDYLRSLKSRAKRADRLIQIKHSVVRNQRDAYAKLLEKITALQQELSNLECDELKLDPKEMLHSEQVAQSKLCGIKEKALTIQSSLSYLDKYKEIWECLGLEWDTPCIKELQSQFCKMKNNFEQKVKCLDNTRKALGETEAIICNLQKHCDALKDCSKSTSQIGLLSEKILSWRVAHAKYLTQEALTLLGKMEVDDTSLKQGKVQQIRKLGAKIDELAQMTQAVQEKSKHEQGIHSQLDRSLGILKEMKSQLQLPVLLDLETQTIAYEMAHCKALEEALEVETRFAENLIEKKRDAREGKPSFQDKLGTELDELRALKFQLKADIAARESALEEAFEAVKSYNEAAEKTAELHSQCEALLTAPPLGLEEPGESSLLWQRKREEFESAKALVEELAPVVESKIEAKAKQRVEKTLQDLTAKSLIIKELEGKRQADMQRCLEKYQRFKRSKEMIRANLNDVERMLQKALQHVPMSYKDALEHLEQSKTMASQLVSVEEDIMKLRKESGELDSVCNENDCALITMIVSVLWIKWLYLLRTAKEWESKCEEQVQEWKSISEEMEREAIILDNLQEELPENPKEKERATKEELQEFLECAKCYKESVDTEKLLLRLMLQRIRKILNVPMCPEGGSDSPAVNEIHSMQDRTKELCQKVHKQKDAAESEIEDRTKVNEDIAVVKRSLQEIESLLHERETLNEKAANLEEIQRALNMQKQNLEQIMDKLRIKYSEMYTIVPVEIETHLEDCKHTVQDLEEKVSTEFLKQSSHYVTNKKIEEINKGLQAVENMLQQKSDNVAKAKDIQKRIWDFLDLWHYKMNELDSEVQEIVEQDPSQGQELMDQLMIPLQRYQQVSQSAERRTANLNRAASKMEECDELLQSTRVWLKNTNCLITEEANTESAKALNKHMSALQMAFEDSEQKQNMLSAIYPELEEFSTLIETDHLVQELNEVNDQVKALQQKIVEILPRIQHLADEVEAIESEVKMMEKDVDKIKTILAPSEDTLSFSPKDHLKHGQVILAHISPMQKAVVEIQTYKEKLNLPGLTLKPLAVFQRTKELAKELKTLERITREQNALLEPIVKELEKNEQEIDYLKQFQFLKTESDELFRETQLPSQGDETEKVKQQVALLCQRKEDILAAMKDALMELHQRQDPIEVEDDILESPASEEHGGRVDWQPKKRGSLSLLPSLVEEVEDSSFHDDSKASSPQITNTDDPLRRLRGDAEEPVDPCRPGSEPAQVLRACQAQITELKLWLKQAKETLGSETQSRQMQQTVEQHLAACQVSLAEIEQKVTQLLDDCKDKPTSDSPGLQQEAESLSLKLKDVKCNLERVQDMLQDKHVGKELSPDENISDLSKKIPCATSDESPFNKSNGLEQQQELLLKLSEQTNLIDFLNVYMEKIQSQAGDGTALELQSSFEKPTSGNDPRGLTLKGQAGDKWQYLQEELLFKMNLSNCQFAEPQISTKINILPKGATSSVRTPTVEELKTYTAQLGSLSQEASVQIQENLAGEVSSGLDQKLFELLLAISRCLNNMEQMLNNYVLTSEEVPMQQALCETLSEELQKLHADIDDKKDDLLKSITCAGGNPDRFSQCFSNLQTWVQLTQAAAASKGKSMKEELDHHSNFQKEIRRLYDTLIEKKSELQQDFNAASGQSVSKQLQLTDTSEVDLQSLEMQTAKLRDHGERLNFPVAVIHEVYKLEDVLDDLWEILRVKQRELISPFIDGQQYEVLLQGLAELAELGREKTAQVPKLRPTGQANLQFHLQNHKSFFCNLNNHMLLAQMCSKKVAPSVLQKTEKFWNELVGDVKSLEQQAVQHGAHLERLLQDWIQFDDSYASFCPKLEALSSTLPSVNLVEETEESLMERIQLLQQIKFKVEEEQAWYFQIVKEGRKLLEFVNCPELQSQVEKLEEQWTSLSGKVVHELQRLETLLKLLSSYNRDSKELHNWLESAQHRVNNWKIQSLNAAQDVNTVRNHLDSLLEFSKEVDDKSSLKSSVISTGNQLLLLKESSATLLRSFLAEYEQRWANLISQLPSIQEKFHQLQMARMRSDEAIEELTAWISHVNQERRDEAVVNLQSPVCQVKSLLKKYKEYLIEMNFKQWVVDYVNQSLLQMKILNIENERYERTAFAERLGEMNLQWHTLQGALNGKVKELELILESVAENECKAQSLDSWFEAQSKRLQQAEKPASLAAAQETARNCKALEYQLALKSKDMDHLKEYYAEEAVAKISRLNEMRARIVNQVAHLKSSTEAALEQWRVYDEAWDEMKLMGASASYFMEHSKCPVLVYENLKKQVDNLQSLQDKMENNEEIWARIQTAAGNLKKLCDPSFSAIIEQKYDEARTRWTFINKELDDQLQKLQSSLHLWESYSSLYAEVMTMLDKHEGQCSCLLVANLPAIHTVDFLKQKMQDVKKLELDLQKIKGRFLQASELADKLVQPNDPTAQPVLPEKLQLLQRISRLEKMLELKANEFQSGLFQLERFENSLERLEKQVKDSTEVLDHLCQGGEDSDQLMTQMVSLAALSPEMESLNEVSFRLALSDFTTKRLQNLNWEWAQKTTMALEQCSNLQHFQSPEKFLQRCQKWVQFLEKMKTALKENLGGTLEKLQEQQKEHEILQAEISVNQQIFNSILSKALLIVESGEAENRTAFISKLTLIKEQWQNIVRMVQLRKSEIDHLVKQWQKFTTSLQEITKFLTETNGFITAVKKQEKYSLNQIKNLNLDFKNKEVLLQRWKTKYSFILETGESLLDVAAPEAKAILQMEMKLLQENWDDTQLQLEKTIEQCQVTRQIWESCEKQVEKLHCRLQELKGAIKEPLPEEHDELQEAKEHIMELEKSLASWNQSAKELGTMKVDLARYILAEDVLVLKEQVAHLHRQWEELCLRVSLRKQEIEDRLNAWIVFNEKNKELCAWLVQMESRVLQSADVSIEDMIDKLQKDCMEEINLFSENKLIHLKQMGDQLIKASNKTRVAEIDEKLNKISDRWQHLFDVIGGRVKKLKETFAFIQQLDKNMSNLRTWLARIESELSKPVVYDICNDQEIQKRLAEQQDLQRDIEQHSAGVESVFNICEVLLHDSDACANETECDSIQQTSRSLDRRWRNICAMSMERRMKIEETWRLWQKFLDDYSRFEDWLETAERTAACPNSAEVSYTDAKEELKKFEAFQRQIHERLTQLELINKQYRRLARENRTDSASKLKQMVYEGNQRWDNLQKRVAAILRRLRHFTTQWEDFVGTKDRFLVWLTEMDLQLTNVEHFSENNFNDKMRQLNAFQQEITLNMDLINELIVSGEHLIQKSVPSDAVVIQEELDELKKYYQEVYGRVSRFHQRLLSWHPGLDDEKESSENETETEDSRGIQNDLWHKKVIQESPPTQPSLCHLVPPALVHERSGCETPVSVDSIPLEWDHTGDVGGSSSPEDEEEEPYYSALSAGKSISETHTWHSPESPVCRKHPYSQGEMVRSILLNNPETSTPYKPGYVKQLSTGSMDSIKEISGFLPCEEPQDNQSSMGVATIEKQPGGLERWELIQAQDLSKKLRVKQSVQQWQQLNLDLSNINAWLDKMEEELEKLQEAETATSIPDIEQRVKKLKDMLKAFDHHKALVLSVILTSKEFKQGDSTGSKELQNRLRRVNLRWEKANLLLENWRKNLQEGLMCCQDFREMNQKLLLWLAGAETRRHQAKVKALSTDPHIVQESRKELMQLEKELLERQLQVNMLQEISTYLLVKSDGEDYIEADEKIHVIGKKLKQLLEGVSQDLKVSQGSQDLSTFLPDGSRLDSGDYHQLLDKPCLSKSKTDGKKTTERKNRNNIRMEERESQGAHQMAPKSCSFFYRVLRAALPLQLLFLLLLLLAFMIPSSEEDYSCTQANNFARSFYPMLRYTKGPPPT